MKITIELADIDKIDMNIDAIVRATKKANGHDQVLLIGTKHILMAIRDKASEIDTKITQSMQYGNHISRGN